MGPVAVEAVTAVLTFIIIVGAGIGIREVTRVDSAVEAAGAQTQSQLG